MSEPVIIHADGTKVSGAIIRAGDGWNLALAPRELAFLRVDHQARLSLGEAGEIEVVIECPFVVSTGEREFHLDPAQRDGLGPFLSLYPDILSHASVDPEGTLRLAFGSGAMLTVRADPQYEAWQVNGPGTFLVVCMPGTSGELAIWD